MENILTGKDRIKEMGRLARYSLWSIIILFVLSRIVVSLIFNGYLPSKMFLHIRGHHIHHFVYGIFGLVSLGAWLTFWGANSHKSRRVAAIAYGVFVTLLFDELVFWLIVDDSNYYHRLSRDSTIIVASLIGATSLIPRLRRWGVDRWWEYLGVWLLVILGGAVLIWQGMDLWDAVQIVSKSEKG